MKAALLLVSWLAATASAGTLPLDGGEPGRAYREFLEAAAARDWRALHGVMTARGFGQLTQERLGGFSDPTGAEVVVRGQQDGPRAELEVELRNQVSPDFTRSTTGAALLVLEGGRWRVAIDEGDPGSAPLAFETAETVRRLREMAGFLEGMLMEGRLPATVSGKQLASAVAIPGFQPYDADGWGRPLVYRKHESGHAFVLISPGGDGTEDAGRYDAGGMPKPAAVEETEEPGADVVVASPGPMFLRYPKGAAID
jgi:hypothetical protein